MKINKKKAMLIGLASSVLFGSGGCEKKNSTEVSEPATDNITSESNDLPTVYGPPESFTSTDTSITTEDNQLEDVYGPPEDFGLYGDPDIKINEGSESPDIEENAIPAVYGPPEAFTEE